MLAHIPNLLTILRLALVPAFIVVVYEHDYANALLIFLIAGITDAADGYIAKRYDCVSHLGALLDPVADKCLLISAYGMLTFVGAIPFWLTVTVIFRDVLIVGGFIIVQAMYGTTQTPPTRLSKFNTLAQIILVLIVMAELSGWMPTHSWKTPLFLLVLFTTVLSGLQYLWLWGFHRGDTGPEPAERK